MNTWHFNCTQFLLDISSIARYHYRMTRLSKGDNMSEQSETLGSVLREARLSAGLSQREVERATGVSNAYLSQLESGKVHEPSPKILHKLSEIYEVAYADLLIAAGYPLPETRGKRRAALRSTSRLGPISTEEEAELKKYLDFLRSKERTRRR
jgi:HTH-type transcriptional regulator, competence development regulator